MKQRPDSARTVFSQKGLSELAIRPHDEKLDATQEDYEYGKQRRTVELLKVQLNPPHKEKAQGKLRKRVVHTDFHYRRHLSDYREVGFSCEDESLTFVTSQEF